MDLQMFTCSNIEDLVVASARLNLSDRRSKSPYDKKNDKKFPPYRNYSKSPSQGSYDKTKRSSNEQRDRSSSKDRHFRKDSRGRQHQGRSYRDEKDYKYQPGRDKSKTSSGDRYTKRRNGSADRINHQVIEIEETTRGKQVRGLPAIPGVDHQFIEIAEHKTAFGVEIAI